MKAKGSRRYKYDNHQVARAEMVLPLIQYVTKLFNDKKLLE